VLTFITFTTIVLYRVVFAFNDWKTLYTRILEFSMLAARATYAARASGVAVLALILGGRFAPAFATHHAVFIKDAFLAQAKLGRGLGRRALLVALVAPYHTHSFSHYSIQVLYCMEYLNTGRVVIHRRMAPPMRA
jgi:hypothetical protein